MKKYIVYIRKNIKTSKVYIGLTGRTVDERAGERRTELPKERKW